jgi:hypothetical protein
MTQIAGNRSVLVALFADILARLLSRHERTAAA